MIFLLQHLRDINFDLIVRAVYDHRASPVLQSIAIDMLDFDIDLLRNNLVRRVVARAVEERDRVDSCAAEDDAGKWLLDLSVTRCLIAQLPAYMTRDLPRVSDRRAK